MVFVTITTKKNEIIDGILPTDIFLSVNLNYRRILKFYLPTEKSVDNTNFIYLQKNPSVKFVHNSNFFYRQIYRRTFPSVKETGNVPPKFELPTNLPTKKSVSKRSGNFPPKFELPTDLSVNTYITRNSSVKSVDN